MPTLEVYRGADGLHYWRLVTRGKVVADGSEGYANRSNARRAAKRVQQLMAKAVVA